MEIFKNITQNLNLENFVDNYPDVFTNVVDNLEPIHLYQLCKTSKGGLNKLCQQLKEQNTIIHNGISYVDYSYGFSIMCINIKGKLYFIHNDGLLYNGIEYEQDTPIDLNINLSVFSVCFSNEDNFCYILDIYGILWGFNFYIDNAVLSIDKLSKVNNNKILSITPINNTIIINTLHGVYTEEQLKEYEKPANQISGGYNFFIMLSSSRELMGIGSNSYGQLGVLLDDADYSWDFNIIPINNIVSIHCGGYHTIIRTKYHLYAFGSNSYGQLCLGDTVNRHKPTIINLTKFTINDIVHVSCGSTYTMILTKKGLYGFGWDFLGEKYLKYPKNNAIVQKIKLDYPISDIESIVCKYNYTIIKRKTDQIYVDGYYGLIAKNYYYIWSALYSTRDEFHIAYKL